MTVRAVHDALAQGQESKKKERMIRTLQGLLRDSFRMRKDGVVYSKLAHCQGYADGYMRILVDAGYVTQHELLELVADVRRGLDGPATAQVQPELELTVCEAVR